MALKAPWEAFDDEYGRTYYHNPDTDITTWDHPGTEEEPESRSWLDHQDVSVESVGAVLHPESLTPDAHEIVTDKSTQQDQTDHLWPSAISGDDQYVYQMRIPLPTCLPTSTVQKDIGGAPV